jgi:hypothetical protein
MMGPIFASFVTGTVVKAATNKTQTSAQGHDRVEFFQNIKLNAIKCIMRSAGAAFASAASDHSYKAYVMTSTNVLATCVMGTVAGVGTSGGISATYANVDAGSELEIRRKIAADGTLTTHSAGSCDVYLEYYNRR